VGTNDLEAEWRTTVYNITHLMVAITDKYPNAQVIWSTILPRPAPNRWFDAEDVRLNIIDINNEMKERQRALRIYVCPSHTSFHNRRFPLKKLFAIDYLHLKDKGTFLLRELFRQHLLRLRDLWGIETWPINEIPQIETKIDRNWLALLRDDRI